MTPEPLKPAIDSHMTDEEIQALTEKYRYLLDIGDGGYLYDTWCKGVLEYTKAVLGLPHQEYDGGGKWVDAP